MVVGILVATELALVAIPLPYCGAFRKEWQT